MKKLDRFSIVQRVGEAGGATLYKAEEALPAGQKRLVLLKVFPSMGAADKAAEARFARELRPLIALNGLPQLAAFHGAGVVDGVPWIATQAVEATLAETMGDLPATPEQVTRLLEQAGTALAAMHSLEVPMLHNDLIPQNILVVQGRWYVLGGLTLAAPASEEPTRSVQSVPYGAPEGQSRDLGQPCPSTDLYAMGHIAYQWALGTKLHRQQFPGVFDERTSAKEAPAQKWMGWHCSIGMAATPINQVRKEFPAGLSAVIAKLMAKQMDARYGSAEEMLADLRGGTATAPSAEPPAIPAASAAAASGAPAKPAVEAPPKAFVRTLRPSPLAKPPAAPAVPAAGPTRAAAPARVAAGPGMFYVRLRDRKSGPFDFATLQRQAKQGMLSRLHQVSTDQVNWRPAGTVEGLF